MSEQIQHLIQYVEVAVKPTRQQLYLNNFQIDKTYTYHLPDDLIGQVQIGHLVEVPFGTAQQPGIVLAIKDETDISLTKPVTGLLDESPCLSPQQIAVSLWISENYHTPLGQCLWLWLPPGINGYADTEIYLLAPDTSLRGEVQSAIMEALEKNNPVKLSTLKRTIKNPSLRSSLKRLEEKGVIQQKPILSPPGSKPRQLKTVSLQIAADQIRSHARHLGRSSAVANLLEVIASRPDDPIEINTALSLAETSRASLKKLEELDLIQIERTARSEQDLIYLTMPEEAFEENIINLRGGWQEIEILEWLAEQGSWTDLSILIAETGATKTQLARLSESGLIKIQSRPDFKDSLKDKQFIPAIPPLLTDDQQAVWEVIEKSIHAWQWSQELSLPERAFLLHGVTGSGKTEIYMRAIDLTLAQGRQAIFLVPEIALTAQTIRRLIQRFPDQVALIHGQLSQRERYDTWYRARKGEINIIIGTRSALFTPLPDLGLIVIDEEHDGSYKQSPPFSPPFYHAPTLARKIVEQNDAVLVLGSATPDIERFYQAKNGLYTYLSLPNRILGHKARILGEAKKQGGGTVYQLITETTMAADLPPVQVVDMRKELQANNTSMFSYALQNALTEVLNRSEQAILFMNRRGQATYVFCRDCGYVVQCPNCATPMTYHRQGEAMRCHHCNFMMMPPHICSQCASKRIKFFGAGTQQIEAQVQELYPLARIVRWDTDTATSPELHEEILVKFMDHQADILIGTQMIAKGLDLPKVTLVGVVSADQGLNLPDFRAGERVFQILTQVSGRAGRGVLGGKVILQTYQPDHYVIDAASDHHYQRFFTREMAYRREMAYPPFRRMIRLLFKGPSMGAAAEQAKLAKARIESILQEHNITDTTLIGPAPCFFERVQNEYRWQLLLRGANPLAIIQQLELEIGWVVDIDPQDLL